MNFITSTAGNNLALCRCHQSLKHLSLFYRQHSRQKKTLNIRNVEFLFNAHWLLELLATIYSVRYFRSKALVQKAHFGPCQTSMMECFSKNNFNYFEILKWFL